MKTLVLVLVLFPALALSVSGCKKSLPGGEKGNRDATGRRLLMSKKKPDFIRRLPPKPIKRPRPDCKAYRKQFKAALGKATDRCKQDSDCAFYPIWVDCGGVSDKVSALKLRAMRARYRREGCPKWLVHCAPRIRGKALCMKGQCMEGPRPGGLHDRGRSRRR